ncbi:Trk family potassium uptake protein [candidate division KSB1 bacterium]|nr:Trk family potassium uptake protein [candidate division KSB1 bacterium]
MNQSSRRFTLRIHPSHTLPLSFFILILLGFVLLVLPISHQEELSAIDALFTATSATCVTGLVVVDTGSHLSLFGQWVVLFLIQFGGLGIMTFSAFFVFLFQGRFSIKSRDLVEKSFRGGSIPQLGRLLMMVIMITLLLETLGAVVLTLRFAQEFPLSRAIYLAVFHSISAFCNAGFSLFSTSMLDFQTDLTVNLTLMVLIVCGGLGFWVFFDFYRCFKKRRFFHALSLHSKIVVSVTGTLILVGFVLFLFFEWNHALREFSFGHKMVLAAFQSITTRTAGFNSVPIEQLRNATCLLFMILMVIGASPGSCGGGIKTTSFAVLTAVILSRLRDRRQVQLWQRGIPEHLVSKAIAIAFFWIVAVTVVSLFLMSFAYPGVSDDQSRVLFIEILFESFSAIGTVGLSMGLTPELTDIGKILIILLMFVGRIGPATLAIAVATRSHSRLQLAEEEFLVG